MATCAKCRRPLPGNGKCIFCGDPAFGSDRSGSGEPSGFKKWAGRLVNAAVVGGLLYGGYWLFISEPGRAALDSFMRKIKLKAPRQPATSAQTLLMKYPKVAAMIENWAITIEEEQVDEQTFKVSLMSTKGGRVIRPAFSVNVNTKVVTGLDDNAVEALKK